MTLPADYLSYFAGDGIKEGGLSVNPGWFQLWRPDQIESMNREYRVHEFAPGFLGFGSSGGGDLLAFDKDGRVVMIPFIPMSADEAKPVADSWSQFIERIER